jgi:hypothetical protein
MVDVEAFETFLQRCRDYLTGTLHLPASLETRPAPPALPVFLAHDYRYLGGAIAGRPVLIMVGPAEGVPPASIARHRQQVAAATNSLVIIGAERLPNMARARLIVQAIPFVVPGNQFYAPHLGIDLREQFLLPPKPQPRLMPAEQAILFHYLLGNIENVAPTYQVIERSGYSPMSVSRATDTLTQLGLANTETHGRARPLLFDVDKRALFERAKPFLKSPVRGRHAVTFTRGRPRMLEAGETALARETLLSHPTIPVFAIPAREWQRVFVNNGIIDHHYAHEGEAIIETWRYDPAPLATRWDNVGDTVDDFSLYASLAEENDERVQLALAELMEHHRW